MAKHTGHPWRVNPNNLTEVWCGDIVEHGNGDGHYPANGADVYGTEDAEGNASIMAAGLDMVEALEELVAIIEPMIGMIAGYDLDSFTLQPARDAIVKARGTVKEEVDGN